MAGQDRFGAKSSFAIQGGSATLFKLEALEREGIAAIGALPCSIKVLLESALRCVDDLAVTAGAVETIARWGPQTAGKVEIPFMPARVILQDFTGVPSIVDLAALKSAMRRLGGDPGLIDPVVPVDLVIDHSVQVDSFASRASLEFNAKKEFERNKERYEFLKWGQAAFKNLRVVPPATGIVHQVNLEYLAKVVQMRPDGPGGEPVVFPDSLVGTDSHTPMINGLGVAGWGVGGIEAEAVMLGQPIHMLLPEVIGFKLTGALQPRATATDLVLTITRMLRKKGVVGKFVEFFGAGTANLSLPDRATLANMAPEYGATMGFFPVDEETLRYLSQTGRDRAHVDLVERYTKEQGMFRVDDQETPRFTQILELDLSTVTPCLSGPKRPQDRVELAGLKGRWREMLEAPVGPQGFGLPASKACAQVKAGADPYELKHGHVVIAAITSCTNTSNPQVMIGAGLLAKKAVERGLKVKPWVKTSLAPGSKVVTAYLEKSGLYSYLEDLNFHLVGYGCTTCIGNSGPLPAPVASAIRNGDLIGVAVLSGNRNFEGRINPLVQASFLASPPLVVAFAIAGTVALDMYEEPLGLDTAGRPVFLSEIWPSHEEIQRVIEESLTPEMFVQQYREVFTGNRQWNDVPVRDSDLYAWNANSTYIQEPPFFKDMTRELPPARSIRGARVLAVLPDSTTTDHISPAGAIEPGSPAATYLVGRGVGQADWNSYGSRRGNHEVMMRGTLANIRIKNKLLPGVEGGETLHFPSGDRLAIWDAAQRYRQEGTPLLLLAGKEYGAGSSRDWAAKGPALQGVRAVIAQSYERIHRSNLIGMGILPLEFMPGDSVESLGLSGRETYEIQGLDDEMEPGSRCTVNAVSDNGALTSFSVVSRIDAKVEGDYFRNGGILHMVLRKMLPDR